MSETLFTTDPKHPSSNFPTGVKRNFQNIVSKIVAWSIFWVPLGILIYFGFDQPDHELWKLLGFWNSFLIWAIVWTIFFALLKWQFNSLKDRVRVESVNEGVADAFGGDDLGGCIIGILLIFLYPFVPFFSYAFGKKTNEFLNRFVYWKDKVYLIDQRNEVQEVEGTYFLIWIWAFFFRVADKHDKHALIVEEALEKRRSKSKKKILKLPPKQANLLDDMKKNLKKFTEDELSDPTDTWIREEKNFLEQVRLHLDQQGTEMTPLIAQEAKRALSNYLEKNR